MKKDNWDKMAETIGEYMKEKGWNILVIGEPRVEQEIGSLKYNFQLVFRFTGKKFGKETEDYKEVKIRNK